MQWNVGGWGLHRAVVCRTRVCSTWVCRMQGFAGHRGFGGAGRCRVQGFSGCSSLQGAVVFRVWEFAGHRDLQGGCKPQPRHTWLLAPEVWLRLPPACQRLGFWVVTGLALQPVLLLLPWVPGTGVAMQGFPISFDHSSGQPVLLSPVSIRFQLKPNAFSSLSCTAVQALPKMKQIPTDCNSNCSSIRARSQCDHKTSSTKTNNPTKPHPSLTASSGMPLK